MAESVRARRSTDQKGQRLTQIVRGGRGNRFGRSGDDQPGLLVGHTDAGDRPAGRRGRGQTPSGMSSTPSTSEGWPRWTLGGWEPPPPRTSFSSTATAWPRTARGGQTDRCRARRRPGDGQASPHRAAGHRQPRPRDVRHRVRAVATCRCPKSCTRHAAC